MFSRRILLALAVFAFGVPSPRVLAQDRTGDVQVRVTSANGAGCGQQLRLDLIGSSSGTQTTSYTNTDCTATFSNLAVGTYHIEVSGAGIETTDSPSFEVDERKLGQYQFISAKPAGKSISPLAGSNATVSAAALKIPGAAQKNFDKASQMIAKENWPKARENLNKALAIYPQYAEAYNNLAVVFGRMGDPTSELENLEKAIALNPHFAAAYVNLGKMSFKQSDMPSAESFFQKAVAAGATDASTLTLLANAQLLNRRYEQAVATCVSLHNGPPAPHTFCHYISAHAMESQHRMESARQELRLFLAEESTGSRADQVRKELAGLKTN